RLMEKGIGAGERVALLLYDSPEFIAWFLAAAAVGAIGVPINTLLSAEDTRWIVENCGARLVVCDSELESKLTIAEDGAPSIVAVDRRQSLLTTVEASRVETASTLRNSPAFMLYTSGSTGTPKGAIHSHAAPRETARNYSDNILKLTQEDRLFSSSRLFFAY